eukprot:scpid106058/ scgid30416/ 
MGVQSAVPTPNENTCTTESTMSKHQNVCLHQSQNKFHASCASHSNTAGLTNGRLDEVAPHSNMASHYTVYEEGARDGPALYSNKGDLICCCHSTYSTVTFS